MPGVVASAGDYTVELGTGWDSNSFRLDDPLKGVLDNTTYLLGPGADEFADITDYVLGVSYSRGRKEPFDQFGAGTMSFTLNDTLAGGILNPYDESSPYYDPGNDQPGLAPMRRVRLFRENVQLFDGVVESFDYEYNLDRQNLVSVRCVDNFWLLANTFMDEYNVSAETSGQRITSVLALPEVDYTGATSIAAGTVNLGHDAAYTVPAGTNVLAYLQQINQTAEFGRLFIDSTGQLVFQNRVGTTLSGPIAEFSDQGTDYKYRSVAIQFDARQVVNRAVVTALDNDTATAQDTNSQAEYFVQTRDVSQSLLHLQTEIDEAADYLLAPQPSPRLTALTTNLAMLTEAQRDTVATVDIGDTIEITVNVENYGTITSELSVEGIDGTIDLNGGHTLTFYTSNTTVVYLLILDDPVHGVLDSTNVLG
jgi:hypothetical protein